ncbi:glutamate-5-semialdehyde dehydrogenase [Nocardiopsis terrae]|uniref:glutamate-5-semialdehyde dehydrogenase n=2 Tax=Nocardiopsis terrae TaxID=372655 RepID=UPI0027E56078|nr:glutamate-5-semialdehyde dehydrogenase [Nocardiopsis terrae]
MTDMRANPEQVLSNARQALRSSPSVGAPAYQRYCAELARRLEEHWPEVRRANDQDVHEAQRRGLPATIVDRLRLTDQHLTDLTSRAAEVGEGLASFARRKPEHRVGDSIALRRVHKPLGVLFLVYEARPTVTFDGALLPVAMGNAVLLRGGKEMALTDAALQEVARAALRDAGLPEHLVTVINDADRSVMKAFLARPDAIDVLIPRGSPSLVDYCRSNSSIPLIASGGGTNHLYVHRSADLGMAAEVTLDSKIPEPAGCTSVELVLVDEEVGDRYLAALHESASARGEELTVRLCPGLTPPHTSGGPLRVESLQEYDLGREFASPTIGVLAVSGVDAAVRHIGEHGSAHTEGVITAEPAVAEEFTGRVDAAALIVNGSLRLHDAPTLGLGPELAISTGRLHARGPVTLEDLVTHSWLVESEGALRG